jgi:predicted O-methyltransferase YrrM
MNPIALEHPYVKNETEILHAVQTLMCPADALGKLDAIDLESIFRSAEYAAEWEEIIKKTDVFALSDHNGSVNPGDRRVLYYLARALSPDAVLEIGTHLGGSTVHLALAQEKNGIGKITTVDIRDVNDAKTEPWKQCHSKFSPKEMLEQINCSDRVEFITDTSLNFFSEQANYYDLIFLDGDHKGAVAYQEIARSLEHLRRGGYILLHDYFPNLEPLWSDDSVIPGPALAVQRLKDEGALFAVGPLGTLPWQTKLNSNVTSLALIGGA